MEIVLTETLGIILGTSDGAELGPFDGMSDGLMLGTSLGSSLGEVDGSLDGASEGTRLGSSLGDVDGPLEGSRLGSLDGSSEGIALGKEVGISVPKHRNTPSSKLRHMLVIPEPPGQHLSSGSLGPLH